MKKNLNNHLYGLKSVECYTGENAQPYIDFVRGTHANDNIFAVFRKPYNLQEQVKRLLLF